MGDRRARGRHAPFRRRNPERRRPRAPSFFPRPRPRADRWRAWPAARGLLPCNFSTLRPKSQETDGASAHPPTQTQVKEASTHSLTPSCQLARPATQRLSQYLQIITILHFTAQPSQTLIRRTRPSTRRPSPSRATSAAVLALFSLLSPAAGSAHPRRARHYARAGASSSGRVAQCLSSVYKMGTHGSSRGLNFPARSRSPPQLSFSPPLSKVASAMTPKGGRVGDVGSKKPTPGPHPRYIPRRGSVLKGIVRGVLGLVFTLISAPANSGGHRVRPAPPAPGEGGGSDDGADQGK